MSNRRLSTTGPGVAIVAAALAVACGGGGGGSSAPTAPAPVTPTPTQITLTAEVRNSDGTTVGQVEWKVAPNSNLVVSVADLKSKGVDTSRLADGHLVARTPDGAELIGDFISSTRINQLALPTTANKALVIYGLNNTNNADYEGAFKADGAGWGRGFGNGVLARTITIRKLPAGYVLPESSQFVMVDGPEAPITEAIDWGQAAFTLINGKRIISLRYVGDAAEAKARVGYFKSVPGYMGAHIDSFYGANDILVPYREAAIQFGSEQMEMILEADDVENYTKDPVVWVESRALSTRLGFDYARAAALFSPQ